MDRFECEECGQFFYFDLKLEGMEAEPGQRLALACPHCEHKWSFFRPDETDGIKVLR
jgi:DNA-directed RNA polymerase subunit RPC12/RpoP